jgi:membrane complex biogenesis BtpA family protein
MAVERIAELAAKEAKVLIGAGFDGLIVENMHDAPYVHAGVERRHAPEIVAAMTRCVLAVREAVGPKISIGVQVLSGGNQEAIAIALAAGADFIRCENFVFAHVADEGLLERAEAGTLLRYRKMIGAERVRVFTDIKKKHASHAITADVSIADAVEAAAFFGSDGVIITGTATGRPTEPDDIREAREAAGTRESGATRLPVLVGSGVTPETAKELFEAGADALIVGSYIKRDGHWAGAIDGKRCRAMVRSVRAK